MSIRKKIVFSNSNKEKYVSICMNVWPEHFQSEKSVLNFIQDIDLWSFEKNRDEHNLIVTIYNYLKTQATTLDVEIYRSETGLMVLVYSDITTVNPYEIWNEWIRFANLSFPFDFVIYIMPYGNISLNDGKIPLPSDYYKLDKELTNKYAKLKVFF